MSPPLPSPRFHPVSVCEARKRQGRQAFGSFFLLPRSPWPCSRRKGEGETFVVPQLGSPPACCLLRALGIILGRVCWGVFLGRSVLCPRLHGWIVETAPGCRLLKLMGRNRGPAVTQEMFKCSVNRRKKTWIFSN